MFGNDFIYFFRSFISGFIFLACLFSSVSVFADAVPVTSGVSVSCENFLRHSGLQDVLDQTPQWIEAELAASNGFLQAKPELAGQIKEQLRQRFVAQGKINLCAKATEAVGESNMELAGIRLAMPEFSRLAAFRSEALRDEERFVEYQKKMRGVAPLEARQEWIRKLDMASGVTAFKTAVWVEIRKTILWSVGQSAGKAFSEAELDRELIAFQRETAERMQNETTDIWLFAYKTVPTSTLEQLFGALDQAAPQKTAAAMLAAVRMMGQEGRR